MLRGLGLRYPELCLLGIYRRLPDQPDTATMGTVDAGYA
jgi:hypothetical protein